MKSYRKYKKRKTRKHCKTRKGGEPNSQQIQRCAYDSSSLSWPTNYGCLSGTTETIITTKVGDRFDRFGWPTGYYLGNDSSTYDMRSLSHVKQMNECNDVYAYKLQHQLIKYTLYEVLKPFNLKTCEIEPWFNHSGHGIQYRTYENTIPDTNKISIKHDVSDGKNGNLPPVKVPNIQELVDYGYLKIINTSTYPMFK